MARKQEKQEVNFEFYIRVGNNEPIDMTTLSKKEQDEIGVRLNDTALRAIGYVPDESA